MRQHRLIRWGLGLALLVLCAGSIHAQTTGPSDPCRHPRANPSGPTPGEDIPVDLAAVTVINTDRTLCGGIIQNTSGSQPLRCTAISDRVPTGSEGFYIPPMAALMLGVEAQPGWMCVRDTTATGTGSVSIVELFP
jgi:hypothetical protein